MKNYFSYIVFAALIPFFAACTDGNDFSDDFSPSLTLGSMSADGVENGHQWVDLGLSVKWATMNVGATTELDYGNYYAWGETEAKSDYSWSTYKYGNSSSTLTKYCAESGYGSLDNLTQLELTDDVAHVKWGGSWRMPTIDELEELNSKCTWKWVYNGYVVVGPSGKSIFLPAAGFRYDTVLSSAGPYGDYWSSSLNEFLQDCGRNLHFYKGEHSTLLFDRYYGFSVRPVTE